MSEALLFANLKKEIDALVAKYGAENAPPPWQTFTIANDIQDGNLHFVQKVFEGAFEVSGFLGEMLGDSLAGVV